MTGRTLEAKYKLMSDIRELIEAEAKNIRDLRDAIDATYEKRGESKAAMDDWSKACRRAHQYVSLIHDWLRQIDKANLSESPELKDFAITFLEMDPMYFGSGYIKERLLRRLKSAQLDNAEVARLTAVLVDAVRRRGRREFRYYCRLAAVLQQPEVLEESLRLVASSDGRVAARAQLMLQYVQGPNHPTRR
jgi:hypothetical protein